MESDTDLIINCKIEGSAAGQAQQDSTLIVLEAQSDSANCYTYYQRNPADGYELIAGALNTPAKCLEAANRVVTNLINSEHNFVCAVIPEGIVPSELDQNRN